MKALAQYLATNWQLNADFESEIEKLKLQKVTADYILYTQFNDGIKMCAIRGQALTIPI